MKPYEKGYIAVGDGHRLYYERCGNRSGLPVIFLHGGPGSGFVESHKKSFDFKKFDVLFFDQRGAGRSKPFASCEANTTDHLVNDICFLLDRFGLKKVIVFGGSWGSTLALVFAIRHPERVSALVLRGIFLSDEPALAHYLQGGIGAYAPEVWEEFVSLVPHNERKQVAEYYWSKMSSASKATRTKFTYAWAKFELSLLRLEQPTPKEVEAVLAEYSYESLAVLECHYLRAGCFISKDYILRHAANIAKIPTAIVHGQYDLICPPEQAYRLHRKLPRSSLHMVCAGHAATEPEIRKALRTELARFAKLLAKRGLGGKKKKAKSARSLDGRNRPRKSVRSSS